MEIPNYFETGGHRFEIAIGESCMVRTAVLSATVRLTKEREEAACWWPVYTITEGDEVWTSQVDESGDRLDLKPLVYYLVEEAERFCSRCSVPQSFTTRKKAAAYFKKAHRMPQNSAENSVRYPGT